MAIQPSKFRELASFIPEITRLNGSKTAMIWPEKKISYLELDSYTSRVASAIRKLGISKGERIGALMLNSPEMVYAWFGALRAGCIFVPYNSALKGELLSYQIQDSRPELLFVDSELSNQLSKEVAREVNVVWKGGENDSFRSFVDQGSENCPPTKLDPSEPATLVYTSGTTGAPKGVVLSHFSYVNRANEIAWIVDLKEDDVPYNTLPLFHTSGQMMTTLPALINGLTVVEDRWFHASKYWKYAAEQGATASFLLMRTVNALLQRDEYSPNKLRVIMCGGVKLETIQKFETRFGIRLVEGFGMSETCGIAIFNTVKDNKIGSIGKPLPSIEAKILGPQGNEVPAGMKGEIFLRPRVPHTVLEEYFGLSGAHIWRNGEWFATGDIAYKDEEGYYYYVEREKDVIRVKEENILPSDIERAAESHPQVLESVAVGVKSETGDEEILLALKASEKIDPREMFAYLDQKLPFFMVPRYIVFLEEIPKTANQKVSRKLVRETELANAIDAKQLGFRATRPLSLIHI